MSRETLAVFSAECVGVSPTKIAPLGTNPASADVIVFKDGVREVVCPYLNAEGLCNTANSTISGTGLGCVQLAPLFKPGEAFTRIEIVQRSRGQAIPLQVQPMEVPSMQLEPSAAVVAELIDLPAVTTAIEQEMAGKVETSLRELEPEVPLVTESTDLVEVAIQPEEDLPGGVVEATPTKIEISAEAKKALKERISALRKPRKPRTDARSASRPSLRDFVASPISRQHFDAEESAMMGDIRNSFRELGVLSSSQTTLIFEALRAGKSVKDVANMSEFWADIPEQYLDKFHNLLRESKDLEELLAYGNIRLVYFFMRRHKYDLPDPDIFQEGYFGLKHAISMFDHERGVKFSTYAANWIMVHMRRASDNLGRDIRLPIRVRDSIRKAVRISEDFYDKHGHYPDDKELSSLEEEVPGLDVILDNLNSIILPASLDGVVATEEESSPLGDFVPDPGLDVESEVLDSVWQEEVRAVMQAALARLSAEEQQIVISTIVDGNIRRKTGSAVGVDRRTVSKILSRALAKLRNDPGLLRIRQEIRRG